MTINKLDKKIIGSGEVSGVFFTCTWENKDFLVYKRSDYGYEVFKRKLAPLCIDFQNRVYSGSEFKEVYPKSKDFGVWAWLTSTLDRAI